MKHKKNKKKQKNIATERIEILLEQAGREAKAGNLGQADRLVGLARRINTRTKTPIPGELKRRYCKYCYCYLVPGRTSRTRVNSRERRVEVCCLKCSRKMYYAIKRRKK